MCNPIDSMATSQSSLIDCVALVLSIISIIVSVVVAVLNLKQEYRINSLQMESSYFSDIYKEHLIRKLPTARSQLNFDTNGHLLNIVDFVFEINQIRRDSLYFSYSDKVFYDSLVRILTELEDYVVLTPNRSMSTADQALFFSNLQKMLSSLYAHVISKTTGFH